MTSCRHEGPEASGCGDAWEVDDAIEGFCSDCDEGGADDEGDEVVDGIAFASVVKMHPEFDACRVDDDGLDEEGTWVFVSQGFKWWC